MNFLTGIFSLIKTVYILYFKMFYFVFSNVIFLSEDTSFFLASFFHILVAIAFLFSFIITERGTFREMQNFSIIIYSFVLTTIYVFANSNFESVEKYTFGAIFIFGSAIYGILKMRHEMYIVEKGNDYSRYNSYEENHDYYDYEEDLENEIEDLKREIKSLKDKKSES